MQAIGHALWTALLRGQPQALHWLGKAVQDTLLHPAWPHPKGQVLLPEIGLCSGSGGRGMGRTGT